MAKNPRRDPMCRCLLLEIFSPLSKSTSRANDKNATMSAAVNVDLERGGRIFFSQSAIFTTIRNDSQLL